MCVCIYTYMCVYVYVCIHIYKYTYMYVCIYIYGCIHIYMYVYIYKHICVHTYICLYMYTYKRTQSLRTNYGHLLLPCSTCLFSAVPGLGRRADDCVEVAGAGLSDLPKRGPDQWALTMPCPFCRFLSFGRRVL